jgi:hypothetical protein
VTHEVIRAMSCFGINEQPQCPLYEWSTSSMHQIFSFTSTLTLKSLPSSKCMLGRILLLIPVLPVRPFKYDAIKPRSGWVGHCAPRFPLILL